MVKNTEIQDVKEQSDDWIQTYSGRHFYYAKPSAENINIEDIAHALSNQCRFAGHVRSFYSVAQHSVLVSLLMEYWGAPRIAQFSGLMHDAAEAYLVDLPRPIKRYMPFYNEAEERVYEVIRKVYKLPPISPAVRDADNIVLVTEARDLLGAPPDWTLVKQIKPMNKQIVPLCPQEAKLLFLHRYVDLRLELLDENH